MTSVVLFPFPIQTNLTLIDSSLTHFLTQFKPPSIWLDGPPHQIILVSPSFQPYSVIEMQPSMRFLFGLVLPLIFYVLPTLSMNPQEPHEPTESSAVAPRAARTSIPPIIYEEALFKPPSVPFDPKKLYYIVSSMTCHTSWSTALWKKPLILFSQNKRHAEP